MERSPYDQALEAIQSHERILIALPVQPSADAVSAGLALAPVLTSLGKTAILASSNFELPAALGFLPKKHDIHAALDVNRKLVVSVNLNSAKMGELSYVIEGDVLKIFITPKNGTFEPADVNAKAADYAHDLIITLDVQSMAQLGPLFEDNADFFYHIPILNIDHHPGNESFGQINLVDLVATSSSEIVLELLHRLKTDLIDDAVATNLLTGIITKTRCFRTPSVTPKSLAAASQLIEAGARRNDIVKHLFQTHTLATLKLWGRALARLSEDLNGQYVWTTLIKEDFEKSGADKAALAGVTNELIANVPSARVVAIVYEVAAGVYQAEVTSLKQVQISEALRGWPVEGGGDSVVVKLPGRSIEEVGQKLKERIADYFKKQGLIG